MTNLYVMDLWSNMYLFSSSCLLNPEISGLSPTFYLVTESGTGHGSLPKELKSSYFL